MKRIRKVIVATVIGVVVGVLSFVFRKEIEQVFINAIVFLNDIEEGETLNHIKEIGVGLLILFLHMTVDFIIGLINAIFFQKSKKTEHGGLSSKKGTRGLMKKVSILLLVFLTYFIKPIGPELFLSMVSAFSIMELLSIVENLSLMGVPIPKKLLKVLEVMKNEEEKEEKKTKEKEEKNPKKEEHDEFNAYKRNKRNRR